MSQDNTKTEHIIAPAIGRALSAIAQRRTSVIGSPIVRAKTEDASEQHSVSTVCSRTSACAM